MCFVQMFLLSTNLVMQATPSFRFLPLNEGVACEDYQKLYTVFAVIQASPQYKSHSVSNQIFNALY